jgi:Xaa-Pro aminopeptidase
MEGVFGLRARVEGNDVGYGSICAAGTHACTLHWTDNDGPVREGDLVLLDMGVEGHELYTADVTRTLPVSGRFTDRQREVYTLVYASQEAALAACKPGADFLDPHRAAMKVLAHGLERMGIVESAETALAEDNQSYRRYTLHGVSHMLGIDVHDCAHARKDVYKGKLEVGYVLTIEPGLYFQPDDLTVPEDLRGIGVRIEDDVVVTADGCRNLSAALPRHPDDVEAWMGRLRDESLSH